MSMATKDRAYNPLLKSYPDSERVNSVSEGAECLYTRLIAQSDDAGRYSADPAWVLARLFTHRMGSGLTAAEVGKRIEELWLADLIRVYEISGRRYLQLVDVFKTFRKDVKQKVVYPQPLTELGPHPSRTRNEFGPLEPEPEPYPELEPDPEISASADSAARSQANESTAAAVAEPPGLTEWAFPLQKPGAIWRLPAAKLDEYLESYPGLDLCAELRKARQWCRDHADRRKSGHRGMLAFLTKWFNRACDSRPAIANSAGPGIGRHERNVATSERVIDQLFGESENGR